MRVPSERTSRRILACLSHAEERIARFYRLHMASDFRPQIRSLIQAICDQKAEKAQRIGRFMASPSISGLPPRLPLPVLPALGSGPATESDFLYFISRNENAFMEAYQLQVAACAEKSEASGFFTALARESMRHASWVTERLRSEKTA